MGVILSMDPFSSSTGAIIAFQYNTASPPKTAPNPAACMSTKAGPALVLNGEIQEQVAASWGNDKIRINRKMIAMPAKYIFFIGS